VSGVALEAHLRVARQSGRKLLLPYVTGGIRADWIDLLSAMIDAGADAIEVGIPFSDPMMDGPTIQEASVVALARGVTPVSVLEDLRDLDAPVPLVVMTYSNIVFRAGLTRFAQSLADAGVGGAILPDVPLEELDPWATPALRAGVDTVLLASPITPDDRLKEVCDRSKGYVYGVNIMGVTGERATLAESSGILARRLKAVTDLPVIMGFGIATPDHARQAATEADGVIVASALMRAVLNGASPAEVGTQVAAMRAALDAG
jgi:tryptophan synthase alpha chain